MVSKWDLSELVSNVYSIWFLIGMILYSNAVFECKRCAKTT